RPDRRADCAPSNQRGVRGVLANYDYRLGPLGWDTSEEGVAYWRAPVGAVGMVDLGRESDFGSPGSDRLMCVFAVPAGIKISNDTWPLLATGDMREIAVTSLMQDLWESQSGYRPSGDKLVDLIFDYLTSGSDPDWGDACKPLMPTVRGNLDLHFGGHSLVKRERFRFGVHPHTNRVKALLHRQFAELAEAAGKGRLKDKDHHRRVLDYWCEKYKLTGKDDWKELVPAELQKDVPGRLKHETTITESFNKADSDTLGPDLMWTETQGDIDVVSNTAWHQTVAGRSVARAESDLSSADHYAQAVVTLTSGTSTNVSPCCRFDAATTGQENHNSYIFTVAFNGSYFLRKLLNGVITELDTGASSNPSGT